MTHTTPQPVEYKTSAEIIQKVMADLGHHDQIETSDKIKLPQAHLITIPEHRKVVNLTAEIRNAASFTKPLRRKGTARLADLTSLINWSNRFKGKSSVLFANPDMKDPTLTCISDYHLEGPTDPQGDSTARHCHHRGVYDFPLSNEWKAWMAISNRPLGKDEMGEFIESQAKDIMDPTPAVIKGTYQDKNKIWENRLIETAKKIEGHYGQLTQLLAMSKQFQIFETSDLKISTNRDTGEQEIKFLNEHKTAEGKPLKVPNLIIIAIPVFNGGDLYRMPVRFRYRKSGGEVKFTLTIYNPERSFQAAFDMAIDTATKATELPTFMGSPES